MKYKSSKTKKIEKLQEENISLRKYIRDNSIKTLERQIEETMCAKENFEELMDECEQIKAQYNRLINELQMDINEYHQQINKELKTL